MTGAIPSGADTASLMMAAGTAETGARDMRWQYDIDEALWCFGTARYTVALFAREEDISPEGQFSDPRDVAFACEDDPAHWFCAEMVVFAAHIDDLVSGEAGEEAIIGRDVLGGCSYGSFREFYSAHRWQYSRRRKQWITDPKSRAWKACEARRPRRPDGNRADGTYFTDMVFEATREARHHVALQSEGARRA